MGKISNITNSSDPQSIRSRVFVGCLNTFLLSKDEVRSIFDRYGSIIGISMHKGYAFVQYTDETSARTAVAGEDQRVYAGQQIDVNLSSEPKADRSSKKRHSAKEWSATAILSHFPPIFAISQPYADLTPNISMGPALKRRLIGEVPVRVSPATSAAGNRSEPRSNQSEAVDESQATKAIPNTGDDLFGKVSVSEKLLPVEHRSFPREQTDILICGKCRQLFHDGQQLIKHKRTGCRLRFACKCRTEMESDDLVGEMEEKQEDKNSVCSYSGSSPICATCQESFTSWYTLCLHCQTVHSMPIYLRPAK